MVDMGEGLNCMSGSGEVGGCGAGEKFTPKMSPSSSISDHSSSPSVETADSRLFKTAGTDGDDGSEMSSQRCSRVRDRVSGPSSWLLRAGRMRRLEVEFRIAGMVRLYGTFWCRSR